MPPTEAPPWGYARGVDLSEEGVLVVADSSADGWLGADDRDGSVYEAPMPSLAATGASGAPDEDQVFVRLDASEALIDGLSSPFEAWLWRPPDTWPVAR